MFYNGDDEPGDVFQSVATVILFDAQIFRPFFDHDDEASSLASEYF